MTNLSLFADETFDVVYDGNCFHCVPGTKRSIALAEWKRILKPKGILFISSLCAPSEDPKFPEAFNPSTRVLSESGVPFRFIPTPEAIESELHVAGFEIVNKVVRTERPFGHINLHVVRVD